MHTRRQDEPRAGQRCLPLLVYGVLVCSVLLPVYAGAQQKPLPDQEALRLRALATAERTIEQRDRYECRERQVQNELDSKGRLKKSTTLEQIFFFLHGKPILREVSKDGKPLSAGDQHKQDERVRKQIEDAEKAFRKDKHGDESPLASRNFLKLAKLSNERRVIVSGRPTIVFDVVEVPEHGGDLAQKIVAAMRGTLSVDEETGHVQDLNVTGTRDVKIGGGLVANIHKGFLLHFISAPQNDGVWLPKNVYGSGDARLGLFFHPYENFHAETESCKLYDVQADAVVKEVEAKP